MSEISYFVGPFLRKMASIRQNRGLYLPAAPRRIFLLQRPHIRPHGEDGALHKLSVIMTPIRAVARLLLVVPDLAHPVHADLLRHLTGRNELAGPVVPHDQSLALVVVAALLHGSVRGVSVDLG